VKKGLEVIREGKVAVVVLAGQSAAKIDPQMEPTASVGQIDLGLPSEKTVF